jgi:GNAT superfamily N-acetyltransferase
MTADRAQRPEKGFCGYAPDLEGEVVEFQRAAYPQRDAAMILPNWRWLFVESARRLGMDPMVWMYRRGGRVVAHQGAIAVRCRLAGREPLATGWFVETMAAEEIRGTAIGPMLVRKALEDLPCNLSLGQTDQMRELQFALGWQKVMDLNTYLFVTGLSMDLRNKLPPGLAQAAAATLGFRDRLRLARWRSVCRGMGEVRPVERFGAAHDALWARVSDGYRCAVVRDASYLNWKYLDRPGGDFTCLELVRDGAPAGVVVLTVREPDAVYAYQRGYIVDLVVPAADEASVRWALVAALDHLTGLGAMTATCYLGSASLEPMLVRFGFTQRSPRHQLLLAPGELAGAARDTFLDPAAWLVTMGDSDVDAYAG